MKEKIAFLFDSGVKLGKSSYEGTISQFEDAMQLYAEEYAKAFIEYAFIGMSHRPIIELLNEFKESLKK